MSFFAKNLKFLRKNANHKQDEISLLFNKRANTIGNWENGKSQPSLEELIKLGGYFKVSIQDLLQEDLEKQLPLPDTDSAEHTGHTSPSHRMQEPLNSTQREVNSEGFWVILRELKALHEKIDLLASGTELSSFKRNSDKSNH
jgi:transcriptional regulator with XRE-family HTH domain